MVTLRKLLGARTEVLYECMYTKNKTQKRKTWHDGFVSLSATHKLVLYDDMPPAGKVLDEAKMSQYDWERRDEEHINVPKFLVEIINETPIEVGGSASASAASAYDNNTTATGPSTAPAPPRVAASKFRVPVAADSNAGPPRMGMRPGAGARQPLRRYNDPQPPPPTLQQQQPSPSPPPLQQQRPAPMPPAISIDFDRNPTSEWTYAPNAVNRSVDEVAALFDR